MSFPIKLCHHNVPAYGVIEHFFTNTFFCTLPAGNYPSGVSKITHRKSRDFAEETHRARVRRARKIHRILTEFYPDARCELNFANPFELLVATVLSAQTTDVRVNQVTEELFARFPTPEALAKATITEVEEIIRSTGFFRAKARNIVALAGKLVDTYNGEVPATREELVTLPGTGRKTAHVVLGNAFDTPGLTVDTHVGRLSRRLGWTQHQDPLNIEHDVVRLFPRKELTMLSHRLIFHGRRICKARSPRCEACPITSLCPSYGIQT